MSYIPVDIKASNSQAVITSTGNIYYQEFRTGNRPKSDRVLIGYLALTEDGDIMPIFDKWDEFDAIASASTEVNATLSSAKSAKSPKEQLEKIQSECDRLSDLLKAHPLFPVNSLNSSVSTAIWKKIGTAKFKNEFALNGDRVRFLPIQTEESWLESEAKRILTSFNGQLEEQGIEEGHMSLRQARSIIAKRYAPKAEAKTTAKSK